MKKCLIVGKFAIGRNILDGQTIKCETIYDELLKKYGQNNVVRIDTYEWKSKPIRIFIDCLVGVIKCENVIIMPAHNGIKIFAPMFSFYKKMFNRKIHYIVIGSWLFQKVQSSKKLKKSLTQGNVGVIIVHVLENRAHDSLAQLAEQLTLNQ